MAHSQSTLDARFAVVEEIAARDLNNLYLTSRFFTDAARYRAFCALYALMRVIDDRVDAISDREALSSDARRREHDAIDAWSGAFLDAVQGADDRAPKIEAAEELLAEARFVDTPARVGDERAPAILASASRAMHEFSVPVVLWRNFFDAMHVDVDQSRFATWDDFLLYTEGASVSPTTIYLALIVAERHEDGTYRSPSTFDLLCTGRHLGTFAYVGHILRDFAEDLLTGARGLVYLARDDLARHDLDEAVLRADVARGAAGPRLRALARELAARADVHLKAGRTLLAPVLDDLAPDRAYVLELIVTIYERVLAKIAAHDFDIAGDRHRLTMDEKQALAADVAARVGYAARD
ncbi:MAG: squalene/phytoene synthase family protein [Acidobacteriota bacterium]